LHKIKQQKGVLFGPNSNGITKQNKCEKWKEVIKLAESTGLAVAVLWRPTVAGADPNFVGPKICTILGALFKKKKRVQNYEYKIMNTTINYTYVYKQSKHSCVLTVYIHKCN